MKVGDLFRYSTDNLRRRLGRTALTIIGVVVGVCAIIVMVSLGLAVRNAIETMLANWGDLTKIEVMSYGAQQGTPDLDDSMVANFHNIPHVVAATPTKNSNVVYGQFAAGMNDRYQMNASLIGMDPDAVEPMGYELIAGTYFPLNVRYPSDTIPVLISDYSWFNLEDTSKSQQNPDRMNFPIYSDGEDYGAGAPLNLPKYDEDGKLLNPEEGFIDLMNTPLIYRMQVGNDEDTNEAKYKDYKVQVVGMLHADTSDWELMYSVIVPLDVMNTLEKDYYKTTGETPSSSRGGMYYGGGGDNTTQVGGYDQVYVKADNVDNMPDIEQAIQEYGYQLYSMSEERKTLQGQVAQTQMMLGGLAAVSLFVAALNIMNTMTMAIYERTKEIGVMKVLGCRLKNIRTMFLIESGAIGFVGGIIGVAVSVILGFLLNNLPKLLALLGIEGGIDVASMFGLGGLTSAMPDTKLSVIPLWLVVLALLFATCVGILSGIAPANKAVKISSLEAIRHE